MDKYTHGAPLVQSVLLSVEDDQIKELNKATLSAHIKTDIRRKPNTHRQNGR